MKNRLKSVIVAVFFVGSAFSIPTDSLFLNIPANILPTLSKKQRFELAEYSKAAKPDSVPNLFGRNTILLKYDTAACHIVVKTSETGTTEIKRFKFSNGENIIGVIYTVNMPVEYSSLNFYNENWQSVSITVNMPDYTHWIDEKLFAKSGIEVAWVANLLNKKYFSIRFNDSNELEIKNNVINTLTIEDRKMVEPFFVNKNLTLKFIN